MNKAGRGDGISVELFQILKDDAIKVLYSICQHFAKLSSGHRTRKGHFSFQFQRRAMPNCSAQLHSFYIPGGLPSMGSHRVRHTGIQTQWVLGGITMNKASGGDGISVELFQSLKDDAVKVLYSICQQIWKTQQWPQDWKRSVFILIPKKGNAKECSSYHTIAFISHASKELLKILQARLLQHSVN